MPIRIYNTLTRRKEEFRPLADNEVKMYVCGPTVYDEPHIGHARSAYVFDVIRRYFVYKGYKVKFVRNITDVDDKIINKAREEFPDRGIEEAVREVANKYTEVYHDYMERLGVMKPDAEPRATEYIAKMQEFIKLLIDKGVAYEAKGDVYFDIRKAKRYGRLSNQNMKSLRSGARIFPGEDKRDPLDFALWKRAKEDEVAWDSPWGRGRPGWHIECSVMSLDILGDEFDIHGGGIDLVFPHHENELAQSEGAEKGFARYWIHNGLLTINKEKMAKSAGNFVTMEDLLQRFHPDVLKILFLQTHYSHPVDFSWDRMDEARRALERFTILFDKIDGMKTESVRVKKGIDSTSYAFQKKDGFFRKRFENAMEDDFNTAEALAVMFEAVGFINKVIMDGASQGIAAGLNLAATLKEMGNILGLFEILVENRPSGIKEEDIRRLIDERNHARKHKDFKKADAIRSELEKKGVILEDNKTGTTWRIR